MTDHFVNIFKDTKGQIVTAEGEYAVGQQLPTTLDEAKEEICHFAVVVKDWSYVATASTDGQHHDLSKFAEWAEDAAHTARQIDWPHCGEKYKEYLETVKSSADERPTYYDMNTGETYRVGALHG